MRRYYILFLMIIACFFGCSSDDSDDVQSTTLTGKIRGVDFTYGSGRFVDFGAQSDEFVIRIDNAGPMIMDSCDTNSDDVYVRLDAAKSVGRKDLFFDNSTGDGITVVFHHPDFFQNLIIEDGGYYDIKSFNTNEMVIEFDIRRDDNNFLKGRATLYKCN